MTTKRLMLLMATLWVTAGAAWAQSGKIEGRVVDQEGEPLIGVNVIVEGTTRGASTDL